MQELSWRPPHSAYSHLLSALTQEAGTVWVVGGAVRDQLVDLHDPAADLDVVVDQEAIPVARRLADRLGWDFYVLDPLRDIARLLFTANQERSLTCDISRIRGFSIEDDLATRDFTVNAMAVELNPSSSPKLLDFHGGRQDLEDRILRSVTPLSLSEDSIRLLRAPRLMIQFDLSVEDATRAQIERLADTVRLCSPERVRDEMWRMLATSNPREAIELLDSFGTLHYGLPEVSATIGVEQTAPHYQDVYAHTLAVIEWMTCLREWLLKGTPIDDEGGAPGLQQMLSRHEFELKRYFTEPIAVGHSRADWLIWHALMHDTGKPSSATVEVNDDPVSGKPVKRIRFIGHEDASASVVADRLKQLRFGKYEIAMAEAVAKHHMRLHHLHSSFKEDSIDRRAIFRFFRDIGGQQVGQWTGIDVILLSLADYLGTYRNLPDDWPVYLKHASQLLDDVFATSDTTTTSIQPLVNGNDLMQHLSIAPGKRVGDLLERILEAQASGEITSQEEAMEFAERQLAEEVTQ